MACEVVCDVVRPTRANSVYSHFDAMSATPSDLKPFVYRSSRATDEPAFPRWLDNYYIGYSSLFTT